MSTRSPDRTFPRGLLQQLASEASPKLVRGTFVRACDKKGKDVKLANRWWDSNAKESVAVSTESLEVIAGVFKLTVEELYGRVAREKESTATPQPVSVGKPAMGSTSKGGSKSPSVHASVVTDADSETFIESLRLYINEKRLGTDSQLPPEIVQESVRKCQTGPLDGVHYRALTVQHDEAATGRSVACGFGYIGIHANLPWAHIAYVVCKQIEGDSHAARRELFSAIKAEVATVCGTSDALITMECDSPLANATDDKKRRRAITRLQSFELASIEAGLKLRVVDLPTYVPPDVMIPAPDDKPQQSLVLLAASKQLPLFWERERTTEVLGWIFKELYPSGVYDIENERKAFLDYCCQEFDREVSLVGERTPLLHVSRWLERTSAP